MTIRKRDLSLLAAAALLLSGCSSPRQPAKEAEAPKVEEAPDTFRVRLTTSKGAIMIEVHKAWAPIGAQHFYDLVKAGYYDGDRFFRVVNGFVVQFGMNGDPATTARWDKTIQDDPVLKTNKPGSVTFAAASMPNSRSTHVFINLGNNARLDSQRFAPFGTVVEGMSVVENLYKGYGDNPDQDMIRQRGNAYLNEQFPKLDYIEKAEILPAG